MPVRRPLLCSCRLLVLVSLLALAPATALAGGLADILSSSAAALSSGQEGTEETTATGGIKHALAKAVQEAVASLGAEDGFLGNQLVRIPMPEELSMAANLLSAIGQKQLVTDFVTSMNRAAEEAVPQTAEVLADAIRGMTLADAKALATGAKDAATRYFEENTRAELFTRIEPIAAQAMEDVGVTRYYKRIQSAASSSGFTQEDLDSYVTAKALDGLFLVMADKESEIRDNPALQTTNLLSTVFGAN